MIYALQRQPPMTIALADRSLRLNPMGRAIYNIYFARGVLDFVGAHYEGCREWMAQALREMPMFPPRLAMSGRLFSKLGQHDEARNVVRRLLAVTPDATLTRVRLRSTSYAGTEAAHNSATRCWMGCDRPVYRKVEPTFCNGGGHGEGVTS